MVESRWVFSPTDYALKTSALDEDYDEVWQGFPKAELPK
jgi:homogentisate 1,2-dioxygenase